MYMYFYELFVLNDTKIDNYDYVCMDHMLM